MSRYKDADAMIRELKRQYMFLFGTEEIPSGIGMFIENFPAADVVKVVHGEWIVLYDEDSPQDGIWKCSVCDYIRFVDDITPMNYCPNCGAKMDKR